MSADRIGEKCPECGEFGLREWIEIGIQPPTAALVVVTVPATLYAEYDAVCRGCNWHFKHRFDPVTVPVGQNTSI